MTVRLTAFLWFASALVLSASLMAQVDGPLDHEKIICERSKVADNDKIDWAPDLATAMKMAKEQDKPVLLVFLCRYLGNCNSPYA